jgi:3-oxoacyl-[acyl-carrier protein] reductase
MISVPHSFADLQGKVVLVTGASSGIGTAVASAFAACGARVAIHYHKGLEPATQLAEQLAADDLECWLEQADLSVRGIASDLVDRIVARAGRLDVLVNNAGAIGQRAPIADVTDAIYDEVIDLNLRATFEACRAAVPAFRAQGSGSIINTTSVSGRQGGGPGAVIYAAAKSAIATLTRGLARELGPEGLRVNAVSPGFIETPLHARGTSRAVRDRYLQNVPLGRLGEASDCTGAFLFLASEGLAGYVTGQVIEVNGGLLMP